jgi:hypothetical protein
MKELITLGLFLGGFFLLCLVSQGILSVTPTIFIGALMMVGGAAMSRNPG